MKKIFFCGAFVFSFYFIAFCAEFVTVGDLGNPGKVVPFTSKNGYPRGSVAYPYRIAKTEVSNQEYAEFLNAAAKKDLDGLYNPNMKIQRSGDAGSYVYMVDPENAKKPVNYVSRMDAAQYCNWLSKGDVYHFFKGVRPNGSAASGIVGWRDLTTPDSPRLYFLPDMHEFYKAGFYDGKGKYPVVTKKNAKEPSHYGIEKYASGVSEWMDNKYYGGAPFQLGANEMEQDDALLNTIRFLQKNENSEGEPGGFRLASTTDIAIAPMLNSKKNFFFSGSPKIADLRIRYAGVPRKGAFRVEIQNFRYETVFRKRIQMDLKPGINVLKLDLPEKDGYYELSVYPEDSIYEGKSVQINFAVMREKMPDYGANGDFGFTIHLQRWANSFINELPDFEIIRELGASIIRNDAGSGEDGARDLFRTIRKKGFLPLPILQGYSWKAMAISSADKEKSGKWSVHGIAPEFAAAAENAYQFAMKYKNDIHDWELCNEPYYWKMTPEDYAQYAKTLAKAIRLADPKANIILGDISAIHDSVLRIGTGNPVDAVAAHIYGFYTSDFWGIVGKCRQLNSSMAAAGISQKPVWLTEIGVSTYSDTHVIPKRSKAEVERYVGLHTPKTMVGGKAFGASKVLVYTFRDVPLDFLEEDFGMTDRYGCPKFAAVSYRTTARMIGDAAFKGFLKGHSLDSGAIAGFAFRDKSGRDVLAFWRNDPYGYGKFEIPFRKLIHPAKNVTVKSNGNVELVTIDGAVRILENKNGTVDIPVDEYPVFVRGSFQTELEHVPVLRENKVFPKVAGTVKILPDIETVQRGCDELRGIVLKAVPNTMKKVLVRLYNHGGKELRGTMRLESTASWREFQWQVLPSAIKLNVPSDGMGSAEFMIEIPADFLKKEHRYLTASFTGENGEYFTDKVILLPGSAELKRKVETSASKIRPGLWRNYSKGFTLETVDNGSVLKLSWSAKPERGYGNLFLDPPVAFSMNPQKPDKKLEFSFRPDKKNIHAVCLLFLDKSGETFQLKQNTRTLEAGKWQSIEFDPAMILGKNVIHYGGNNDAKVDFPIRLLGFNVEVDLKTGPGSVLIRQYQLR